MSDHPQRHCNGGPHARERCGKVATVVCTERIDGPLPMKWYACELVEHHEGAKTEPIAEWFARLFPEDKCPGAAETARGVDEPQRK